MTDPVPWQVSVFAAPLLDAVSDRFRHYLYVTDAQADVLALWCLHSHATDCFTHSPKLNITSAEKGCGKSTCLDIIATLTPRALKTENIAPAALFRISEMYRPAVIIDEFDSRAIGNEDLNNLLNASFTRGGMAIRCVGENHEPKGFSVYGPIALGGIGRLSPTLFDRSIVIRLQKAKQGEVAGRFDSRRTTIEQELCSKMARWAADNRKELCETDPKLPPGVFNRAADRWRPLFAIAQLAVGHWPSLVTAAFGELEHCDDIEHQGLRVALLDDIRSVYTERRTDEAASRTLCDELARMETRPWPEFKSSLPITPNQLARELRHFGITPRNIRDSERAVVKGYLKTDFVDSWERYLPPPSSLTPPLQTATPLQSP